MNVVREQLITHTHTYTHSYAYYYIWEQIEHIAADDICNICCVMHLFIGETNKKKT